MSFAAALAHRRAVVGMPSEMMADLSGVARSRCASLEAGEDEPTIAEVRAIADVLGPSAAYLLVLSLDERDGVTDAVRDDLIARLERRP